MNGFRIGFVGTLSFLLFIAVVVGTLAYYPAPKGPKAPVYPNYQDYPSPYQSQSLTPTQNNPLAKPAIQVQDDEYSKALKKYNDETKTYKERQLKFTNEKIVPYVRNVFVGWIAAVVAFELIGVLFIKIGSDLVGSGYAFSGMWAVIFGPIGGLVWYASAIISSFARTAEQEVSADPVLKAVTWATVIGVVVMTILGNFLYGKLGIHLPRISSRKQQATQPNQSSN